MFKWLKNKLIKSIINDVKKELPEIKERIEGYWEANKDEIIAEIKEKIKELIKSKVGF
jgi:phage host-nuclease inhibitor protein Gam